MCVILYITMYILNIARAIKKMSVNEIRDFIFANYYKRIEFSKEDSCYLIKCFKTKNAKDLLLLANKLMEKKKKYLILRKWTEINYQLKTLENTNIVGIKSVSSEHPKTSNKLSKTKKVGSNSSSCSATKKGNCFIQEKCKNNKISTCF